MPLSRILTNTYIDKQNNTVSIGTSTPKANVGRAPQGNATLRIAATSTQTAFVANNGNTLITMATSASGMGTSILSVQDVTSDNSNVIFSISRSKVGGANAAVRFGPNYAVSDNDGTTEFAQKGDLYTPVIEMNADTGKITLWADSYVVAGTRYKEPARREALTMNHLGQVTKPYNPSFMAYIGGSNPSYTAGNITIPFNTVTYDVGVNSCYNTSTYRFTAPVAGTYLFTASVNMYSNPGIWMTSFMVNNTYTYLGNRWTSNVSGDNNMSHALAIKLAVNDYVEVRMQVANNGNYSSGYAWNWFSGTLIG